MKNNNPINKEVTLSAIAELIEASAKKTSKALEAKIKSTSEALEAKIEASAKNTIEILEAKIEQSAENLATMTQNQFLELGEKMNSIENKIDRIEGEIIKKVDTVKYNTTKYRVKKLEEKFA
ncbi:MAG: hypothetical protein US57_C0003G0055 [Candidatus Moranbacteria bacterium GW2011_GWC2_37_73]|nr:MAG: hypothetical protein UR95_C0003G0004 [Parcubacteria group bacterium GW2011_GWC1_36_108]KKQ00752.1 MAG: hypothetical protein US10_C0026G0007 [Candidatus Moranbacteria bacterium GW2011_GWD2_36_198]KKQ40247.1 MAG: hypothetical protein US57_C0003G0055 [Candidatus Moranbacteria bacterium GW2011_GWC2_37_73]